MLGICLYRMTNVNSIMNRKNRTQDVTGKKTCLINQLAAIHVFSLNSSAIYQEMASAIKTMIYKIVEGLLHDGPGEVARSLNHNNKGNLNGYSEFLAMI